MQTGTPLTGTREFVIHTDHKNYTYINDSVNEMVVRWKLYLQEYTFKIQYIKGQDNIVADNFSRLCILDEKVRSDISDEQVLQLIEVDETFYDLSELYKVPTKFKKVIYKFHNSGVGWTPRCRAHTAETAIFWS